MLVYNISLYYRYICWHKDARGRGTVPVYRVQQSDVAINHNART